MTDTELDSIFKQFEGSGPPWASQASRVQYEGLRDYLTPKLKQWALRERIDELKFALGNGGESMPSSIMLAKRIAKLNKQLGEDSE